MYTYRLWSPLSDHHYQLPPPPVVVIYTSLRTIPLSGLTCPIVRIHHENHENHENGDHHSETFQHKCFFTLPHSTLPHYHTTTYLTLPHTTLWSAAVARRPIRMVLRCSVSCTQLAHSWLHYMCKINDLTNGWRMERLGLVPRVRVRGAENTLSHEDMRTWGNCGTFMNRFSLDWENQWKKLMKFTCYYVTIYFCHEIIFIAPYSKMRKNLCQNLFR